MGGPYGSNKARTLTKAEVVQLCELVKFWGDKNKGSVVTRIPIYNPEYVMVYKENGKIVYDRLKDNGKYKLDVWQFYGEDNMDKGVEIYIVEENYFNKK